jgi:hypothetical protein
MPSAGSPSVTKVNTTAPITKPHVAAVRQSTHSHRTPPLHSSSHRAGAQPAMSLWRSTLRMTGCLREVHPRRGIGVVIVLAAVAILRMKDRSVLLIAIAAIILLLALSFAIGEVVAPH